MVGDLNPDVGPDKAPGARTPSRLRFTLGAWMLVLVVVGGILSLLAIPFRRQRAEQALEAAFRERRRITQDVLDGPVVKLWPPGSARANGTDSMLGTTDWRLRNRVWSWSPGADQDTPDLIDLEFVCSANHGGPSIVWVFVRGGRFNDTALRLLAAEYGKRGWRLSVVPGRGADERPKAAAGIGPAAQ